jgi:perosamine synthetase
MRTSFEPGAPAATGMVPLSVPELRGNEARYLQECISGGWVSSVGPFVERFEREIAAYVGARCAVATVNGTSALHLALLVAGVQPEDEVLVSNLTFIAPANAIRYAGARPVFIGSEATYWQIDPEKVREFLATRCERRAHGVFNKRSGRQIRALLAVHILGHPADLDALLAVTREFGLLLIEDCAEAIGTEYRGRRVGTFGLLSAFSFNGNKVITCGGGGMLVTNDEALATRARHLSTQAKSDPREYIHDAVGYNYRLTSLQAAVGVAQLEQLDGFLARRREIAARYAEAFAGVEGLRFTEEAPWARSIFWLSTVLINEARFGLGSRALMQRLEEQGIQTRPLWQPMHRSPAHQDCESFSCEIDDYLAAQALSLPSSTGLSAADQDRVIAAVLAAAQRP